MAPLVICIGITTYRDIWTPDFGEELYQLLASQAVSLAPTKARIWGKNSPVDQVEDFAAMWRSQASFTKHAGPRVTSPVVERGHYRLSVEWTRDLAVRCKGFYEPHPETDPRGAHAMILRCRSNRKVGWAALFESLVDLFSPSFAMIDQFAIPLGGALIGSAIGVEAVERYDDAFAGEYWFTRTRLVTGAHHQPDRFDITGRRTYLHLPELPWLSYLGHEFGDVFRSRLPRDVFFRAEKRGPGTLIQLSESINDAAYVELARLRARALFREGFFRCAPRESSEPASC